MAFDPKSNTRNRTGTGFTNLNRVLEANKNNRLGQAVGGGIQQQAQGVRQSTQQAQQQFGEEAQKGRLDTEEAKQQRSNVIGRFTQSGVEPDMSGFRLSSGVQQAYDQAKQKYGTPVKDKKAQALNQAKMNFAEAQYQTDKAKEEKAYRQSELDRLYKPPTEQELQEFTRFRTGTYTGPKEFRNVSNLMGQAQQAESMGDLTRSTGGRQELLRRFVGGEDYTQGQQRLDTALLGQTGDQQLQQARRSARNLEQETIQANREASALAKEYANRAAGFGEETRGQLTQAIQPISTDIDTQLSQYQKTEQERQQSLVEMRKLLGGYTYAKGEKDPYKYLDKVTRTGLALQDLYDRGYIDQTQLNRLVSDKGLIGRAAALGLDTSKLLRDNLQDILAQGLTRRGAATEGQETRMTSLEKLLGEQGVDLEFGGEGEEYAAGSIGLDLDKLEEYIARTEAERRGKQFDPETFQQQMNQMNQLQQLQAYGMMGAGGALEMGGASLEQFMQPADILTYRSTGDVPDYVKNMIANQQKLSGAGVDTATGTGGFLVKQPNAAIEGLLNLNIGGKSLAKTKGGQQLMQALKLKSKLENEALLKGNQELKNKLSQAGALGKKGITDVQQGFQDLLKGNLSSSAANLSGMNLANDISRQISKNISASLGKSLSRNIGNAARSAGGAVKKLFSDENLKENIEPAEQDVKNFLNRINAYKYDYKDEVKGSDKAPEGKNIGVMAQDLEKSKLGKESVEDTKEGKVVDYDKLQPSILASLAEINKRLQKLEDK